MVPKHDLEEFDKEVRATLKGYRQKVGAARSFHVEEGTELIYETARGLGTSLADALKEWRRTLVSLIEGKRLIIWRIKPELDRRRLGAGHQYKIYSRLVAVE